MVEYTCTRCSKKFFKLWKLRHHNERQYKCRPKVIPQITISQVKDQGIPPPVTHIQRRKITKRNKSPIPIFQETSPGLATQAYKEKIALQNEVRKII